MHPINWVDVKNPPAEYLQRLRRQHNPKKVRHTPTRQLNEHRHRVIAPNTKAYLAKKVDILPEIIL